MFDWFLFADIGITESTRLAQLMRENAIRMDVWESLYSKEVNKEPGERLSSFFKIGDWARIQAAMNGGKWQEFVASKRVVPQ
jgi:hypothetical protein